MRKYCTLLLAGCFFRVAVVAQTSAILGFSPTAAAIQLATEKKFDANLRAKNIDLFIKELSAVPHHVGSAGDEANAKYILNKFKSWGYDAEIETFYVLFPTPVTRLLEMTGTKKFTASL